MASLDFGLDVFLDSLDIFFAEFDACQVSGELVKHGCDLVPRFCRHEEGFHFGGSVAGELGVVGCFDGLHVIEVDFVADEHELRQLGFAFESLGHQLEPVFQVLEAFLVGDVVRENDGVGLVDVRRNHFGENTLAPDVPHLHRHANIFRQLQSLHEEVHSDRLLVLFREVVLAEAHYHRRLAHCAVA